MCHSHNDISELPTRSDPPPHSRLIGAVGIAELAFQITLLPLNDADVDHPQQRHHQPDRPQASRRDAQAQVDEGHSQVKRVPGSPMPSTTSAVVGNVGGTLVPAAANSRVPMAIMKKPPAASVAPAT